MPPHCLGAGGDPALRVFLRACARSMDAPVAGIAWSREGRRRRGLKGQGTKTAAAFVAAASKTLGPHLQDAAPPPLPADVRRAALAVMAAALRDLDGAVLGALYVPVLRAEHLQRPAAAALGDLMRLLPPLVPPTSTTLRGVQDIHLRRLADGSHDLITSLDLEGRLTSVSPASTPLLGYRPQDLIGRSIWDLIHPDDHPAAALAYKALLAHHGAPGRLSCRMLTRTGEVRSFETNLAPLLAAGEPRVLGVFNVSRDITDRLALENLLETTRLNAEAANKAKTAFLANMSHELRTPLTSVIGFSHIIQSEPGLTERARRAADRVAAGGKALLKVINDVLDLSRMEAGRMTIALAPTDVEGLVGEVVALLGPAAEAKGLTLLPPVILEVPARVRLDAGRTRQVLMNLLGNAVKFSRTGTITVCAAYEDDPGQIRFSVADEGPGVGSETLARLFEHFSQGDTSTSRSHGGAGLGLTIAKGLVDAMGGALEVRTAEGEGSTFSVTLPAERCAEAWSAGVADDAPVPSGLRAMVVDDNRENLEVMNTILRALGVEVTAAQSGPEALESAGAAVFDVIVMDVRMQGMDGVETIRRIRSTAGPNQYTPALMCSADEEALSSVDAALFDGVIAKPFSPRNIVARIAAVIDSDCMASAQAAA